MQIPDAWDLTGYYGSVRGQNIIIAVIDTGVDVTHPEFGFDPTFDSSTTPYTTPFTNSVNTSANIWLNYYGSNASCWSGGSGESDFYDWDWCINGDWVYQSSDGVDNELNGYVDDWMGWNFVGNTNNVTDDSLNGHGTSVAGIIAAKLNDFQISGAAPQAKIMALKALDSNGNGSSTNIAAAIIYAANKGARVINLSFGGPGYSQTEKDAIDYAISKGAVVIASAGNSGDATPHYPAAYDGVIGVSALDGTLTNLASFSSFGSQVDLAAPGEGVYAPIPGGGYTFQSGSSMSAAYVSGIAALLASYGYYGPEICVPDPDFGDYCYTPVVWPFNTPAAIRTALLNTALDLGTAGYDTQFGNGRVQALNALNSALSADLSLTKSIDNATPYVGGNVNFTLTVTNGGLNSATGVTVKDLLPAPDLTYVSYSGDGTYDSSTGIWTVGSVANGASKSLTITASVVSANIITNVAEIWTSDQSDPDSTPANSASAEDDYATTAATPRVLTADLSLSKTVSNKRPVIGDTVVFEVYAANNTPSDPYVPPDPASNATGVTIKDLLPAGLNYVSHSVTGGTYDSTTGIWDIGTLPSHQGWFLRITAEVTGSGIITNSAEIWTSDLFDPDSTPGNGIATEDDSASVSLRVADPGLTEVFWAQSQTCSGTLTNGNNSIITPYAFDNAVSKCDQPPSTTGVTITNFQRPTGIDTTSFASIYSATLDLHFYVTDWIRIPYTGYGNTYHVEFSPDNGANWYLIGIIPPDYQWPPATLTHFRYNVSDFETIVIRSTINNVVNTPDEVRDFQVRIIKWNDGPEVPAIYIDQASLTVVGNTPPTINITSPGGAYQQGTPITFAAISNDTEDGALAGNIQDIKWKVDNVYIGSGRGFVKADLTPDVHVITATVTDSSGLSSSDTVTISVNPNTAPVVTITAPTVYTFSKGEIVIFKGTGTDIQDGDLTAHLSWYSDIDGLLGNSGIVSVNHLTPGTHTVTAQVTDSNGITGISAPITITITNLSGPHGNFSALTDACAKCHRTHTAPAAGLLLSPESAKTSNTFCLSCHNGTIASAVSTHSNINARMPIESPGFELLCVQCHDAHGTTNLFAVRKEAFTTLNPDTTNGPVTFTSLLGSNSFDDGGLGGSAEANRICVTCHIATSVTMINGHVGGAGHNGNGVTAYNYTEKSCISCHPHDADGVPSTRDGFTVVAGTCDGCHGAPPATGAHLAHSDPATVPTVYGETGAKNSAAAYNFGCGECHPTDVSNHLDGTVEVNLAQETAPTTSLKAKNGRAANSKPATYTSGSCSNVYCHSGNGITSTDPGYPTGGLDEFGNQTYAPYNVATFRTYKTTPAWSNGPTGWAGYDECTGCHAFPPTTYDPSVTKYAGILAYPPFEGASPSYAGVGDSHRALVIDDSAYSSPDSVVDILHSNNMRPYTSEPSIPCRICHFGEITADNGNYVFTANDPSGYTLAINVYNPVPVANRANHVNGYANVNINNAATIVYGGGPPYGQSLSLAFATYNSARQTCSNAGCHYYQPENWWESPRFGQYAPVWGSPYHGSFNAGSIECSACHQW
jgi:predicted CXXCH cytochrome family protein